MKLLKIEDKDREQVNGRKGKIQVFEGKTTEENLVFGVTVHKKKETDDNKTLK